MAQVFLFGVGLAIFISIIWFNIKNIKIDNDNKVISFQNILTRRIRRYNFSDFDGYIDTFIKHGRSGISYRAIGFVVGKTVVRRIDSYYYSNFDKMKANLSNCNYLGEVKFGFWDSIKMMMNEPVLDR